MDTRFKIARIVSILAVICAIVAITIVCKAASPADDSKTEELDWRYPDRSVRCLDCGRGGARLMGEYELRYVKGHVEVYLHGLFQFAADTFAEAREELNNIAN